jgi:2-polyprenyl-3-methyl-5-hydroxy-6-metoxy-1,4-benzoquinol methylase
MSTTEAEKARDALVERLFLASVGMAELLTIHLGDKLGLYAAIDAAGSMTTAGLAERAGIDRRYAREWLEQQAAAGILAVDDTDADPEARRFSLPPGHAEPLLDRDSPWSIAPVGTSFAAIAVVMPQLIEAFRTGKGVTWDAYGEDMTRAQGDFNRPWIRGQLASEYLPSVAELHDRLSSDPPARVLDVACGVGWAGIALASAYPKITVDGVDPDVRSIELARAYAEEAGVGDRVTHHAVDAADPSLEGGYDLAIVVESIHDLSRPVPVLARIRELLAPGATLIVADERTEDRFTAPASETERFFYGYSVLCCLPAAMDDAGSAQTGTVMRRDTFERYAAEAGFSGVSELPFQHDFLRFYRLDR